MRPTGPRRMPVQRLRDGGVEGGAVNVHRRGGARGALRSAYCPS